VAVLSCGRARKPVGSGLTSIVGDELAMLRFSTLRLSPGDEFELTTGEREYAVVLIHGDAELGIGGGERFRLGPRANPFEDPPYAVFATREQSLSFRASAEVLFGLGSAPAAKLMKNTVITPELVKSGDRGAVNWSRHVRMVCWSDNTEGNLLIAGETCTPSGNWSTVPPHRHQHDIPGEEVPYEEIYFFQFSRPQGFGLTWQFDDEGKMDQAFSLRAGDALYMSGGYHPVACGPGSTLYHLSLMAGPYRMSRASVHKDYRYLLEESNLENQYRPEIKK
jgi:5-deoxy-glucuronate isomerase